MAKRRVIDEPIENLGIPWSGTDAQGQWGYDKRRVEDLLKAQLGVKYGDFRTTAPDANNFIHLYCFATPDDAIQYDELIEEERYDEAMELVIKDLTIPINTAQADSYNSYLYTTMDPTANIVVSQPILNVQLRFCAVKVTNGERLNLGSRGTLTIQNSLDNGATWNTVGTLESALNSTDYSQTEIFTTFDLGKFLSKEYTQFIRVRASFKYTDDEDVERIAYSTWVQIANSVTYTQLSLTCLQGWHTPLFAANIRQVGFPTNYMVYGAVAKTLHIRIQGAVAYPLAVNYELGVSDNGVQIAHDISDALDTYKIFDHGVRTVTAWLSCDDGLGGTIESDTLVNRFMVIDYATAAYPNRPYLMLQNVVSRLKNYVQTKICDYAVFNPIVDGENITPGTDPVDVLFYLTNYSATFPSGATLVEYYAFESLVTPGIQNSLTTTVELESAVSGDINTYFRVWRKDDGGNMYNFMQESMGESSLDVVVDNSDSFSPTLGATFAINPKVRNNSERHPDTILNSQANNAEVESEWTGFDFVNDGWVTAEDGVKVLRVLAGESLNIRLNPFAQFLLTPDSAMTLEFDFAVRNVTNEDDPIISLFESVTAAGITNYRGLRIKPMEGNLYTKSNPNDSETNFRYCEEKRTHVSININNAVVPTVNGDGLYDPTAYTPADKIALVRVFVDGNIEREMKFPVNVFDEFCTGEMSNGGITIGQDGADIDIYSIRCYANRQLDSQSIVKNWIATLPTAEEKNAKRRENDILTGGRVDVEKVKALGKRVLILHGDEPYFYRTSVSEVWWEIFQYDREGTLIPELSGTICRATGMKPKRQGSTANTYYYSNIQTKIDDAGSITIPLTQIHNSITVSDPYQIDILDENDQVVGQKWVVDIYGGNLGKYDPVQASPKQYDYDNGQVTVPDGWIDGNGMYRGMGFMVAEGTPLATKLVLKVNYASSMQSHLCGGTRLYNDLHTAVVGRNSLQQAVESARVSKYTEPVFFFTQAEGSNDVVFRGGGNFGAGKMDKPTWGYVKKLHPMFTMIEGSDNNYPLTDMRVPFVMDENCPEHITYSPEDEGYFYNDLQCLDFDAGKTDDNEVPDVNITRRLAEVWNFIYMHSPMIKYFVGTYEQFILSDDAQNTAKKYWCTEGTEAYRLKRYNFVQNRWEDAGLWDSTNQVFEVIDLRTHEYTAATYELSTHKTDFEVLNTELIGAIVAHAKTYIGFYFNVQSLKFHYAFQNHFMAGTDNCSKNTYFVLDPVAKSVTIGNETRVCYLFELHQDDVDTILITDNNGRSTKPYYIDRMHPFDDKDTQQTTSCYEGMNNVLFNLVEEMYEGTRELQSMMKSIFNAMVSLVNTSDNALGYTNSIWGCLQKYLFSIQNFYPAMAYNEQARIRYEWPALLGFVSQGSGARSIAPITQSMGSQLLAETQFMLRRVVYMASYAAWGNFYDAGKTYSVGIADAADTFSLQAFHLPNQTESNNNYSFNVKPHQYIYPTGMLGQTSIDPHVRVAPGETYLLNLGSTTSNDTGLSVLGINYYRSVGNIGDLSVRPDVTFEVHGKRLTEFVAEPTTTYVDAGTGLITGAFRPNQLNITAKGVKTVSLKNSGIGGTHNATVLTRLESLDLRGTYIYDVSIPSSEKLHTIHLPASIVSVILAHLPALSTFSMEGFSSLESLYMDSTIDAEVSKQLIQEVYEAPNRVITSLSAYGVDWDVIPAALLTWITTLPTYNLTGSVDVKQYDDLGFDTVMELIDKYGDIHSTSNTLYVRYDKRQISSIYVRGPKYVKQKGLWKGWSVGVKPSTGNDIAVVDGHAAIAWTLTGSSLSQYAELVDDTKGYVNVKKVDIAKNPVKFELGVTLQQTENETVTYSKYVGFAQRIPNVGDFAYGDGDFDNEYDNSKDLVGTVVKIDVTEWYDEQAKIPSKCTCWVYSKEHTTLRSTDGNIATSSLAWGPYTEAAATNGFPSSYLSEVAGYANVNSIMDLPMGNITTSGISNAAQTSTDYRYINDTFIDDEQDDGYAIITTGAAADFNSRAKTEQMVAIANEVIDGYMIDHLHILSARPRTQTELADAMRAIANWANTQGYSAVSRYYQLFFPAAYDCMMYEPNVDGELNDQYKRGKWMLPAAGLIARIYNFYYNSCGRITYNNGGRVTSANANENPRNEARLPLFANLMKRFEDKGITGGSVPFTLPSTSTYHWTCTEYNQLSAWLVVFGNGSFGHNYKYIAGVVRGVAAFDFEIETEPEEEAA